MPSNVKTHNQPEFSVSEISAALKMTVEETFSHVRVRGEVSGVKIASSGHVYFSLKDENAVLNAICWKGTAGKLPFKIEEGLEVIAVGKISTYPGRSNYQIICEWIEPAGVGALMALLEKRKKELAAEGLFDAARKKSLPYLPKIIGVVTSPTGAVIRDILHRLSDRFPCHVIVWPVAVQGEGAAEQVAAAIRGFNKLGIGYQVSGAGDFSETQNPKPETPLRPDLLIVARGGGSLEDLWAFNEEIVVRAAAESEIPLISAVGHETDTTLIDFASDRRAPTPTAAAEMAVPVRAELMAGIMQLGQRLFTNIYRYLENQKNLLVALARGLISPKQMLENMVQRLDDLSERLTGSLPRHLIELNEKLVNIVRLLDSYHYKKVLERGFALVWDDKNNLINSAAKIKDNMLLTLEFADGKKPLSSSGARPTLDKAKKSAKVPPAGQGSLF